MQTPDTLRISFDQNPAVGEATTNLRLGDKFKMEVHCTLKGRDSEGMDAIVEAYVPEGYEVDNSTADLSGSGAPTEPIMTPTAMMVRKKSAS